MACSQRLASGLVGKAALECPRHAPLLDAELAFEQARLTVAETSLSRVLANDGHAHLSASDACRVALLAIAIDRTRDVQHKSQDRLRQAFAYRDNLPPELHARLYTTQAELDGDNNLWQDGHRALSQATALEDLTPSCRARIELQRGQLFAGQCRHQEMTATIKKAQILTEQVEHPRLSWWLQRLRAHEYVVTGKLAKANHTLAGVVYEARTSGAELFALETELILANILLNQGCIADAHDRLSALEEVSRSEGLMPCRLALAKSLLEYNDHNYEPARRQLSIAKRSRLAQVRTGAQQLEQLLDAWQGQKSHEDATTTGATNATVPNANPDRLSQLRLALDLAIARSDPQSVLKYAQEIATIAHRYRYRGELSHSLATRARIALYFGDATTALNAAKRACREATTAKNYRAHCHALAVLAALASHDGDPATAIMYARDIATISRTQGLAVERSIAAKIQEFVCARSDDQDAAPSCATCDIEPENIARVTAQYITELGLSRNRPYRAITSDGTASQLADTDRARLALEHRSLAVDGIGEHLWQNGTVAANLKRRSLLKRLLYKFAAQPGTVFSKEELVESIWHVDYHPLRHDAALFTNIMRLRRLLGQQGNQLLVGDEAGYRFEPPTDFLYFYAANEPD